MTDSPAALALLLLAALAAGALNSIAGGGTLLTFPSLLAVVPPVVANATSTVALVPGSLAGAWGYRRELEGNRRWLAILTVPSLAGGIVGALLVTRLPEKYFAALVPWLVLTATLLFALQPWLARLTGTGSGQRPPSGAGVAAAAAFQFLVAVYGGYFGAGIGILMLSSLGLLGLGDINRLNALKTFLAAIINGVSIAVFAADGKVHWGYAAVMAVAAVAGGYLGARLARRLNRTAVRWVVIAVGLALSADLFAKRTASAGPPQRSHADQTGSARGWGGG